MPALPDIAVGAFVAAMLAASVVDARRRIIPNACVLAGVGAWAVGAVYLCASGQGSGLDAAVVRLAEAAGVSLFALLCAALLAKMGKGQTLGMGDVKLLFPMGLFLGFEGGLAALGFACVLSLAYCGLRAVVRSPVLNFPFAPFLNAAFVAVFAVQML